MLQALRRNVRSIKQFWNFVTFLFKMPILHIICWAFIIVTRLRFPPGDFIAAIVFAQMIVCSEIKAFTRFEGYLALYFWRILPYISSITTVCFQRRRCYWEHYVVLWSTYSVQKPNLASLKNEGKTLKNEGKTHHSTLCSTERENK